MSRSGEQILREISQDITCPGCGYNLRSMTGDVVTCPECGRSCDVAELIRRYWVGSWRRLPKLDTLAWPALWLLLAPVPMGILLWSLGTIFFGILESIYHYDFQCTQTTFVIICVVALMPVWTWRMYRVWRDWPGGAGLALALLGHAVVGAFVGGAYCAVAGVAYWMRLLAFGHTDEALWAIATSAGCVLLLPGGFWGYRFVAEQCIRRFLRRGW
jgi:hypothetical protein